MKTYVVLSEKPWHDVLFFNLQKTYAANWVRINNRGDFSLSNLQEIKPDKVFVVHWSYIIPPEIFNEYECVVFHMTDLPYGRGGSPLQNLIVRGHKSTKISAIKVARGIDAGDVYLKSDLSLDGTATEIFARATDVIEEMIGEMLTKNPQAQAQSGEVVEFKRRKPEESNIKSIEETTVLYDYIRMLDAEGYPNAFLETEHFKLEFTNAELKPDNTLSAHVRIIKK